MPYADLDGRRLHYVRRGDGAPLLLIQGMAGHHRMWGEDFLTRLAAHFDVVAFDHRGIGASSRADEPFTVADLADDAAGVLDAVGWADAHVFGASLGGMVAQELVLRHPDRVRTVAIGCSWAGGPDAVMSTAAPDLVAAMATRDAEKVLRAGFEANLSEAYAADPAHYETYRELAMAEKVPAPVVGMQFAAGRSHDTSARLPEVTTPTLVLHGTEDRMLAVGNGEHIARLVPGARLELFDGAGHLFWWEEPARTVTLLGEHTGVV
jgi:3-oxoadipate enol-lactonase